MKGQQTIWLRTIHCHRINENFNIRTPDDTQQLTLHVLKCRSSDSYKDITSKFPKKMFSK